MKVIGIDPGITGAIALYEGGPSVMVEDIPTVESGSKGKKEVNIQGLCDLFDIVFCGADEAAIERVSAMPKQGVTSSFNFGATYGTLKGVVAGFRIPYTLISAVKWKMDIGLNNDGEKSRQRALEWFPKSSHLFARKMDHNRAEAALIAKYRWSIITGVKLR